MRTFPVVVRPPFGDHFPCVSEAGEPVRIQAFIAEAAIEGFHVAVLQSGGLVRCSAGEYCGVRTSYAVRGRRTPDRGLPNLLRQASGVSQQIEDADHSQPRQAGIHFDGGTLPCVLVNDGEGSKRSSTGKGVADKVHRPSLVGFCQCRLLWPWFSSPRIVATFLSPHSQPVLPVQAIDLLIV